MENSRRICIYLAGGFHSNWQRVVSESLQDVEILDPRQNNLTEPRDYTSWDLDAIRQCDIVLANMEESNPAGYSLSLEVGFAKALEKKIYFVDQIEDAERSRHFDMLRCVVDRCFSTLSDAIRQLALDVTEHNDRQASPLN